MTLTLTRLYTLFVTLTGGVLLILNPRPNKWHNELCRVTTLLHESLETGINRSNNFIVFYIIGAGKTTLVNILAGYK